MKYMVLCVDESGTRHELATLDTFDDAWHEHEFASTFLELNGWIPHKDIHIVAVNDDHPTIAPHCEYYPKWSGEWRMDYNI